MQYIKQQAPLLPQPALTTRNFLTMAAALSLFGLALAASLPFMG